MLEKGKGKENELPGSRHAINFDISFARDDRPVVQKLRQVAIAN